MAQQQGAMVAVTAGPQPLSECVAMLDAQPLFRAIFDHAPLAQMIGTADGTVERINPAFTSLLGYAPEEICGKSVMSITHPDDVPRSWAASRRIGLSLPRVTFQKRYLHKSGRALVALVTLSAVDIGGRRHILVQIVDLTALKQAHSEAEHAHERLQTAIEGASAGVWEIDFATGHLEWDDALRRRMGLAEDEPTPTLDAWLANVHPEDRPSVAAALRNAAMPGHGRFDHEMRMCGPGGAQRWYRGVGRVRFDAAGRAVRAIGIAIDITHAKQVQLDRERMHNALRRAERRLAAIVATTRDAVISAGLDLRITTWNGGAEGMLGYAEAEAIGLHVGEIFPADRRSRFAERVALLQTGDTLTGIESVVLRKDGARIDVEITLSPVFGEDGKVSGYSAIVRDITGRKQAERTARQFQERLEEIADTADQVFWTAEPGAGRMLYVSPSYERIWGRSCESLYANPRSFIDAIHADDREAMLAAMARSHATSAAFSHEYRIVRPDGSVRRIWDRGHAVRNAAGEVTHHVGVAVDMTDRPEAPKEGGAR
jgi:PAS domain S-box-containing protein